MILITELVGETVDIDIIATRRHYFRDRGDKELRYQKAEIQNSAKTGEYRSLQKLKTTKLCKNTKTQEYQYRNSLCSGATFLRGLRRNTLTVLSK